MTSHPSTSAVVRDHSQESLNEEKPSIDIPGDNGSPDVEKQQQSASGAPGSAPSAPSGHVNDLSTVPNGGIQGWLQVVGGFMLFFNTWGLINTWGIYQTTYAEAMLNTYTPSTIAWIGSIQVFCLLAVGAAAGPIYDAGYFRHLVAIGSFLVVFGHMMLSLSTEYYQFFLAQGLCVGLGMSCLFIPSVAILSQYFTTRLALATGLAASGSSLGGVIYPIMLHKLIPQVGFPWAVRIIGFLCLATLIVPNVVMKVRVLPPGRRALVDTKAFKELPYMLFCAAAFLAFFGLYQPLFFVQEYAYVKHITNPDLSFYVLAFLNAASVFGRILPNVLAVYTGPLNLLGPCTLITGILTVCLIPATRAASLIVVVSLLGFFSGSLVSLPSTVVVHLTEDRRFIGTRLGMCFAFSGIAALICTPIGGQVISHSGFNGVWILGAVFLLVGGVLMFVVRGLSKGWKLKTFG